MAATSVAVGERVVWNRSADPVYGPLPARLVNPGLPERSVLLARDGSLLARFYEHNRESVMLASVPPTLREAVIATEDQRFYDHSALDPVAWLRAAWRNLRGGRILQGGSTITEQYVRAVLSLTAPGEQERRDEVERTLARKVRHARYALALETRLTKDEILERYLNVVYFGRGAYGVQAAAQVYFSRPVDRISLTQAALLAGLIRDPAGNDPVRHPAVALTRRDQVLRQMHAVGSIAGAELEAAQRAPLQLRPERIGNGCQTSPAPFFCAHALAELLHNADLGSGVDARRHLLMTGGLRVLTTLDPIVQKTAQAAAERRVPRRSPVAAAVNVVEPGTGAIRAMVVTRAYGAGAGATQVNLATGGITGYPAGSVFKVFVLAAAVERGTPLTLQLLAPPSYTATRYKNCRTGRPFPPYRVRNAEASEGGRYTLLRATWASVNTYYLQLQELTGICRPARIAEQLGIRQVNGSPLARVPSFTLGTSDVSPLDVTGAYAAFAARGRYCRPTAVHAIDVPGRGRVTGSTRCRQAVAQRVADQVTAVLRGVIDGRYPHRTGADASVGVPAAGKTGTTQNFSAAWFCGYTARLAACVWVGDPRGGFRYPLRDVTVGGWRYARVYGATIPAPIWRDTVRPLARK